MHSERCAALQTDLRQPSRFARFLWNNKVANQDAGTGRGDWQTTSVQGEPASGDKTDAVSAHCAAAACGSLWIVQGNAVAMPLPRGLTTLRRELRTAPSHSRQNNSPRTRNLYSLRFQSTIKIVANFRFPRISLAWPPLIDDYVRCAELSCCSDNNGKRPPRGATVDHA